MIALLGIPDLGWIAWSVICLAFAIDAGITFLGWHYTEHHRIPRWRRERTRRRATPMNYRRELSVRDRSRRGPAPKRGQRVG